MERMSEHTRLISSYQLLITAACTNTGGKMKGSHSRAADRYPFVPDIAKLGYFFHALGNVMCITSKYTQVHNDYFGEMDQ